MHDRSYSYEIRDDILIIHAEGRVSIPETQVFLEKTLDEIDEGPYHLIVYDKSSAVMPIRSELEEFFKVISKTPKVDFIVGICVTNSIQAAMGKIMLNLVNTCGLKIKVFNDCEKAYKWISEII
jgi:hypothetical protein